MKKVSTLLREARLLARGLLSVIGGGVKKPEDAQAVASRAVELGFSNSLGIIHDGSGQLKSLSEREARIYEELKRFGKKSWTRLNRFQDDLAYAGLTIGGAALAPGTCTYARTDWFTTVRNSAVIQPFRLKTTPAKTSDASFTQKSHAPGCVPSPAFNRSL